jgi:hypothetical protein
MGWWRTRLGDWLVLPVVDRRRQVKVGVEIKGDVEV